MSLADGSGKSASCVGGDHTEAKRAGGSYSQAPAAFSSAHQMQVKMPTGLLCPVPPRVGGQPESHVLRVQFRGLAPLGTLRPFQGPRSLRAPQRRCWQPAAPPQPCRSPGGQGVRGGPEDAGVRGETRGGCLRKVKSVWRHEQLLGSEPIVLGSNPCSSIRSALCPPGSPSPSLSSESWSRKGSPMAHLSQVSAGAWHQAPWAMQAQPASACSCPTWPAHCLHAPGSPFSPHRLPTVRVRGPALRSARQQRGLRVWAGGCTPPQPWGPLGLRRP